MSRLTETIFSKVPFLARLRQALRRFRQTWPGRLLHCLFVRKRSFFTWMAIMFASLALGAWVDLHTPQPPMDALERHSGELLAVRHNRRATCRSEIQVRGDDGQTRWWMGCFYGAEKYRALVGQRIAFLTQYILSSWLPFPPWHYDEVQHLVTEQGKVLMDYRVNRISTLKFQRPGSSGWKLFRFYLYAAIFIGAWLLLWCVRDLLKEGRCNNDILKQGGEER